MLSAMVTKAHRNYPADPRRGRRGQVGFRLAHGLLARGARIGLDILRCGARLPLGRE